MMKALRLLKLLLALAVLTSCAQMNVSLGVPVGIAENDHEAWVRHYENLAKEARIRLLENKNTLAAYEARPYYYGRQGLDLQSHTSANIRAYEKALRENLEYADLHRKMAMEQKSDRINKVKSKLAPGLTVENTEYSSD